MLLSAVGATAPVGFGCQVEDQRCPAQDQPKPLPQRDIPYMGKEGDVVATKADLRDGVHAVFIFKSIGRGTEGAYTHSAISIIFFDHCKGLNKARVDALIKGGGVGCFYIKDNKVQSLTLRPDALEKFKRMDVQETMLKIGAQIKSIDHPVLLKAAKSNEQYEQFCSNHLAHLLN